MHSRAIGKARMIPWPSSMLCCARQCDMLIRRNMCYAVVELLIKNILCFEIKFPGMAAFWRLHNSPSIIADYLEKLGLIKKKSSRRHCKFCIMKKTAISSESCKSRHLLRRINISHCLVQQSIDEGHGIIRALPIARECMNMIYFLFILTEIFFSSKWLCEKWYSLK
jgi:hypothetical protein